ncbi:tail protein X [Pseudomonas aeruginosa]|uniref:tail protein X n=1 Tax=Pseudomonas aeruginosa TaxID=287 RepID=UPI0009357E55|nr:tail protein X [Pseudomonas aeruginosa]MCS7700325.1 tail protein X [Pseudomonas aeruginosa]
MAIVIANQGDTVDAICWRYYGRTAGVTEAVLDANPGLADLGPVILHGTAVTLPDAAPQAEQRQVVNLWD